MTVRWSLSVLPASQAIQPGRLTTTSIVSFSPAGIRFSGQILSSRTLTGTSDWLRPPTTETRSIVPPPSGIPTLAIALESVVRLAWAEVSTSAAAPASARMSSSTPPPIQRPR